MVLVGDDDDYRMVNGAMSAYTAPEAASALLWIMATIHLCLCACACNLRNVTIKWYRWQPINHLEHIKDKIHTKQFCGDTARCELRVYAEKNKNEISSESQHRSHTTSPHMTHAISKIWLRTSTQQENTQHSHSAHTITMNKINPSIYFKFRANRVSRK